MEKYQFSSEIKQEIKALCRYNNHSGPLALLSDYFFIALAVMAAEYSIYFYPLALLVIGSRQRALATVLHEASHRTLATSRVLNRLLGTYFSGYLVFQSWDAYVQSHVINHHARLGNPDKDPDYQYYIETGIFLERKKKEFIAKYLVRPLFCLNAWATVKYLLRNRLLNMKDRGELLKIVLSHVVLACIGSYFVGLKFYLLYWLLPYVTTFQIITWFIELAEHYPIVKFAKTDLHASRNRFSHPLEAFFTSVHGENFHLIHHLFPGVPFWKMQQAHAILLKDAEYARLNAAFGGIFLSSNFAPSKWARLIFENKSHANAV